MAGGGLQQIKKRVKTVESTMKITKAMELVSTSKLRRAKEQLEDARPFFDHLFETMNNIASSNKEFSSMFTKSNGAKANLYIVIAGDRGLAGGYNSNILKLAAKEIDKENDIVVAIGNKAKDYLKRHGYKVELERVASAENLDFADMEDISKVVIALYRNRKIGGAHIIYTDYLTTLTQEPGMKPILPLDFGKDKNAKPTVGELIEYDPNQDEVFDNIVPTYVTGILYGALVDAYAAENAARRNAMEAANDNAKEIIETLDLLYNRMRQASITQEITEITNGAEALNN